VLLERADEAYRRLEYAEALRQYSRAVQDDQCLLPGWVGQAMANFRLSDHARASTVAAQGLGHYPKSKALLSVRGAARARLGERDEALHSSDLALSFEGDLWLEWVLRGDLLLTLCGSTTPARHCFARALELASGEWLAHLESALTWQEHGFAHEALTAFELPFAHQPETPELLFRYAVCLEQADQPAEAYETVTKLLALAPREARYRQFAERLKPKGLLGHIGRLFGRN